LASGQLPSQLSPDSTTRLPHWGRQSLSLLALQLSGQQPSPPRHWVCWPASTQRTLQPLPSSLRRLQPLLLQLVGQLPSQTSPDSTTSFPHRGLQSLSLLALQLPGQQPSPPMHWVCWRSSTQRALQLPGFSSLRSMQPWGAQLEGQGSHSSAPSLTPLPHLALQSLSLPELHPSGQQPSPFRQAVSLRSSTQRALQVPASSRRRSWQPMAGQETGQGSQVSLCSLMPLPHRAAQSGSLLALQLEGQQPSSGWHLVCWASGMHSAAQVPEFTSLRSWQPSGGHSVGQEVSGSQVSLPSLVPLPQTTRQSLSVSGVQPIGQQPSPSVQPVIWPDSAQRAVHWSAAPCRTKPVQARLGQAVGQLPGGSQVSPGSMTPLPQLMLQSASLVELHAAGQQPSWAVRSQACWSQAEGPSAGPAGPSVPRVGFAGPGRPPSFSSVGGSFRGDGQPVKAIRSKAARRARDSAGDCTSEGVFMMGQGHGRRPESSAHM
jgi:hypothetical protein